MKDIAKDLGISVATVSRALSNSPRISEECRKKVQNYAKEHNFVVDVMASSLRKGVKKPVKMIGVIMPEFVHYYFSSVLEGIETEAVANGYMVVVARSKERYENESRICENFLKQNVAGVIVSQAKDTTHYEHFKKLIEAGIPLVFYDRICTGVNVSRVVVDDYQGAFNAVSYLIEKNSHNIVFYGSPMQLEISKNRFNGYRDALLKNKIPYNEQLFVECDSRADAEVMTPKLMEEHPEVDAFFCVNDDTAVGVLYSVLRMGYKVPEDIQIIGFGNDYHAKACNPMLTTVEQKGINVGEEAANILIDHIEGRIPKDKVDKRIVRTRLLVRGTTK